MNFRSLFLIIAVTALATFNLSRISWAQTCGLQASGALCRDNLCCSEYGYCGHTSAYCCSGCQSQCSCGDGGDLGSLISESLFDEILLHRNDNSCPAKNFYTHSAFIEAANSFSDFGTKGDTTIRKREIAAFLAQTSQETIGGWKDAIDGPYSWGYCYKEEVNPEHNIYCDTSNILWPCAPHQSYHGRGPIQISHNYNYGPAGEKIGENILENPDLVASNPTISFKTALWFWMTAQSPKPSSHDVIIGAWIPSSDDIAANRLSGYGVITNIINGGLECGKGTNLDYRIGFYKRYCDIFQVSYGSNLDCKNQKPFNT
ncbi:Chitinase, family GH19 [Zostera marina]|uniref:chitinase n=1 Tax=Zostera marina TaxID=29655 RepID=A0A0K9PFB4_ZOSMR|nr:Chitinase, family GH19 [Zostera marina]